MERELFLTVHATPNEVIAVGHTIITYLGYLKHKPKITREEQDLISLLESFQKRIATQQHYINLSPTTVSEVKR